VTAPLSDAQLRMVLTPRVSPEWSLERLLILCRAWQSGTELHLIRERVRATKSSALGQVHRLQRCGILDYRRNPVGPRRSSTGNPGPVAQPAIPRAGRSTLPLLPSLQGESP
jgi:hypothetical protein